MQRCALPSVQCKQKREALRCKGSEFLSSVGSRMCQNYAHTNGCVGPTLARVRKRWNGADDWLIQVSPKQNAPVILELMISSQYLPTSFMIQPNNGGPPWGFCPPMFIWRSRSCLLETQLRDMKVQLHCGTLKQRHNGNQQGWQFVKSGNAEKRWK